MESIVTTVLVVQDTQDLTANIKSTNVILNLAAMERLVMNKITTTRATALTDTPVNNAWKTLIGAHKCPVKMELLVCNEKISINVCALRAGQENFVT